MNLTQHTFSASRAWLAALCASTLFAVPASAQTLKFTAATTPFNSPIGIDCEERIDPIDGLTSTYSIVCSVNYHFSGTPPSFETIASNGTHVAFGTESYLDEIKIATIRSGAAGGTGGFTAADVGQLFTGNGVIGQIQRLNKFGALFGAPWPITLPGATPGLMRGSLYQDRTGVFGNDLIVCTTTGQVWRVQSAGTTLLNGGGGSLLPLANIGVHLEGLCTIPDDFLKYGGLAGKILAGAELFPDRLYAIDVNGFVTSWDVGVEIEDIDLIPSGQNFFGVNYGTSTILGVPASNFKDYVGDILLTQEVHAAGSSGLYYLRWDSINLIPVAKEFKIANGSASVDQWEHVTFCTAGIDPIKEVKIGGRKEVTNNTSLTADDLEVVVKGSYPTVLAHFDGGFPTFEINLIGTTLTQFRWSGLNVPPGGKVVVGGFLPGSTLEIVGIFWTLQGVPIGCVPQLNPKYTPGIASYSNTVTSCSAQLLYAGDLTIEYYDSPPALDQLHAAGVRSPIAVDVIPGPPVAIASGGTRAVSVPQPPGNAQFALMIFKVGTSPALSNETQDYMLLPVDWPVGPWVDLGFGLAGVQGVPRLSGSEPLILGTTGTLELAAAAPSAPALLFIALTGNPTPFKGGTLLPVPVLAQLLVFTNGSGASVIPVNWPVGLSGISAYFQYGVLDAAAVFGVSLSNALRADFP